MGVVGSRRAKAAEARFPHLTERVRRRAQRAEHNEPWLEDAAAGAARHDPGRLCGGSASRDLECLVAHAMALRADRRQ